MCIQQQHAGVSATAKQGGPMLYSLAGQSRLRAVVSSTGVAASRNVIIAAAAKESAQSWKRESSQHGRQHGDKEVVNIFVHYCQPLQATAVIR